MRLTKQFFKAAKVYGAESYIRGFSGYVCEILTIYYGSFLKLMKAIPKWKEKSVIDIEKFYKNKNVFFEINKSKLTSPLIVIDPIQKDRNAAAALDREKFFILKHRAKEFLKKPSKDFFKITFLTEQYLREKYHKKNIIILKCKPLKKKIDVAGAKMLKAFHFLEKRLIFNDLNIVESDMLWHNKSSSLFYYVLGNHKFSKTKELQGPPLKVKKHVAIFKRKHKKTFIKNNRIYAIERSKYASARDLMKNLIKISNVKINVKKIELLR